MNNMAFNPEQLLWTEKYRPMTIEDCILPERIKATFRNYVKSGDFPSLLFFGGAGIGKTTLSKALCNEINMDTMTINVSNERGIDVLRTKIESFATSVSLDGGLKCVILDEFDGATEILQKALRAAIEDYSINCRFVLTCNYPNKIIDAIHSRTAPIDMSIRKEEIPDMCKQFLKRCEEILKLEGIQYERKAIITLISRNFPDFRSVLNQMQQFAAVGEIRNEDVETANREISISKLTKALKEKNFKDVRQWVAQNSNADVNILFRKVYESLYEILKPSSIPEVIVILAQYQHYAVTAIDPEINLVACFVEIMAVGEFV